jgi:2-polyprenyl-3-methyl-5-hydroxy-6-metoxy-1,4-benzoquinol methylase
MVEWTDHLLQERTSDAKALAILDLGTGNGSFLFRMAGLGYSNLTGCDYSAASVALTKAIAVRAGTANIRWVEDDLLDTNLRTR